MGYNVHMLVTSLLLWWYGNGWRDQLGLFSDRLARSADYFSIVALLKSLFAPFRQISAGSIGNAPLDAKMRAWIDKLVSRFIGALVRSAIIVIGLIALLFECLFGIIRLLVWPLLPFVPVAGIILAMMGWMPW